MKLNFYLFNDTVKNFNLLLLENKSQKQGGYFEITNFSRPLNFEYKIYLEKNKSKTPKWVNFIKEYAQDNSIEALKNVVNSFVILVKVKLNNNDRFFAITGGFGFNAINRDLIESNFGLITTLNCISPDKIKYFDSKNIDVKTKQKRIISNIATEIFDFDIDFEQDLIRIVSGNSSDRIIGKRMTGADNLCLNSDIVFEQLGDKCILLLKKYLEKTYEKNFDFIKNIIPENNKKIINYLDDNLVQALNNRQDDNKIAIAYPDQFAYEQCHYFKISGKKKKVEKEEIDLIVFYEFLNIYGNIDIDSIKKNIKIIGFEDIELESPKTTSTSVYDFFVFEAEFENNLYVLSNKKWYKIEKDYIKQIDDDLQKFLTQNTCTLKNWDSNLDEGKYTIKNYKNENDYIIFDKKNFYFKETRSKVEITDLFHFPTKKLFFIKKLNRSATLSHLFSQGSVSADLFKGMDDYKNKFINEVNKKYGNILKDDDIKNLVFVYSIGTKKKNNILELLPIFSRINLLKHIKIIHKLGFKVEMIKINIV